MRAVQFGGPQNPLRTAAKRVKKRKPEGIAILVYSLISRRKSADWNRSCRQDRRPTDAVRTGREMTLSFSTLDLNLLRVFDAVMEERSVLRASQKGMPQPVSRQSLAGAPEGDAG